jgi:hypothetical protein
VAAPARPVDAAAADAAGREDPGREEAGREEAGREDLGREDLGREDPGREDLGREDAGREDAGREDPGREDPGREDTGGPETVAATPEPAGDGPADKPAMEGLVSSVAALDAASIPAVRRELPGLAEALDAAAMQPRLAKLFNDGWVVYECSVAERMYLPGAGCTVRYTVELGWEGSDERGEHLVSGRVLPAELSAADWLRERLLPLAADFFERDDLAPFVRPVAAVEQLNMVLYAFPIDLELPGLLAATDPAGAVELVRAAVPDATASQAELVTYGRHGRCVLRYEVDTADGARPASRTLYGKVYAGELGEAGRKAAGAIGGVLSATYGVERTLAYHPGPRLALLAPVPGRPRVLELLEAGAEPGRAEALDNDLAACAQLAAAIHAAPVTVGPERTVETELHTLGSELLGTGGRAPALGVRMSRWLASAQAAAQATAPLPLAPAHGSLAPAKVLFDGDRCGLIGLDTVCRAEPALDLGRFLAHLRVAVAKAGQAAPDADRLATHLLEAYAQAAEVDLEQLSRRTAVFEALSLTRIALRRWAALDPAGLAQVLQLMGERRSPVAETAR